MDAELGYDKTSISSIFEYSKKLIGHSLNEVVDKASFKDLSIHGQGKGGLGQMIEKYFFHHEINNDPGPDFREAGLELKATGLKKINFGELQIKERLVCDMINYAEIVNEPFETSRFYNKCRIMLLIFYLYQKGVDKWDLKYIYTVLWKLPEKDLLIIKHDFEVIVDKVKRGEAHLLSEGDTEYLGACRKGQKGDKPRTQPYSDIPAPARAFALKTAYMRTVLAYVKSKKQAAVSNIDLTQPAESLFTIEQLKNSDFETILLKKFQPWTGKSIREIVSHYAPQMKLKAKDLEYVASCLIASDGRFTGRGKLHIENSEEFRKAGLRLKVIPTFSNGNVKEAMSFENIDFQEIYDNDNWYDSTTYELFSSRFLFVVFRHPDITFGKFKGDLTPMVLEKVFFWTMPTEDLNIAEEYWDDIRTHVLRNDISLQSFWSEADHRKFHVRPKGNVGSYKNAAINPNGGKVDKMCYWFNKGYIRDVISKN